MFNLHLPLLVSTTRFSYPSNFFALFFLFFFPSLPPPFFLRIILTAYRVYVSPSTWLLVCFPIKLSLPSRFSLTLIFARNFYLVFKRRGSIDNKQATLHRSHRGIEIRKRRGFGFGSIPRSIPRSSLWWWETCLLLGLTDLFIPLYSPPPILYPFYTRWQTVPSNLQVSTLFFQRWFMGKVRHLRYTNDFFLALHRWKVFEPYAIKTFQDALSHVCTSFTIKGEVRKIFVSWIHIDSLIINIKNSLLL